jgi:hypothetical protein
LCRPEQPEPRPTEVAGTVAAGMAPKECARAASTGTVYL